MEEQEGKDEDVFFDNVNFGKAHVRNPTIFSRRI